MIDYKQIIPCIYLINGEAVDTYEANRTVIEDPVGLALSYDNYGADAIFVFDFVFLSKLLSFILFIFLFSSKSKDNNFCF